MKFLVVDDSAVSRRILVNCLRMIGHKEIVEAADGKQALGMCDSSIGLVITDWNMPMMTGVELVAKLRANPALASLRVLLVSARNGRDDIVEAVNAGIDGYIVKPFTPDVLKAKLAEMLGSDASADAETTAPTAPAAAEVVAAGAVAAEAVAAVAVTPDAVTPEIVTAEIVAAEAVTPEIGTAEAAGADSNEAATGTDS